MNNTRIILAIGLLPFLVGLSLGPARAQEEPVAPAGVHAVQPTEETVVALGDPAAVLAGFLAALDRGDIAGMLARFTDDGVLAGYGLCRTIPCSDLAAIRSEARRLADEETTTVPLGEDTGVAGHTFTSRIGLTSRSVQSSGLERLIVAVSGDIRGEKLTSLRLAPDLGDEQTAAFYSWPPVMPALSAASEGDGTEFTVHVVNRTTLPAQVEVRLFLWGATVVDSFAGLLGHNPPTVTRLADGGLEVGWSTDTHDMAAARQSGPFIALARSGGAPITARVILRFWGQSFNGAYVTPDLVTP